MVPVDDEIHERLMHVIVIRGDLTNFRHVHPELTDGTWRTAIEVPVGGELRAFADVSSNGPLKTFGVDLQVATLAPAEGRRHAAPLEPTRMDVDLGFRMGHLSLPPRSGAHRLER